MARKPEGTEMSTIERIRALKSEAAELMETAKTAAMEKANEAIAEFKELGLNYRLVEEREYQEPRIRTPRKASSGEPVKRVSKGGECPYCHFVTNPHHDARKHRSQPKDGKRPFTDAELKEMGMERVS